MRNRGLLAVSVALVAVGLVTAGAAAPPTPGADLPSSALETLVATGDLPANVSGEPGVWNFAGPASACPGPGWNCVTLGEDPIVQTGTVNVAQCVGTDCVGITQEGDVNRIECGPGGPPGQTPAQQVPEEKTNPVAVQECGPFTQGGDHNIAIFKLVYDVDQGSTQCVLQKGELEQDGVTNYFKAQFTAKMTTTTGPAQTQDARQRIVVDQNAEERNESEVQEIQVQYATGNATMQNQNTGCPIPLPGTPTPVAGDCNPDGGPLNPVACLKLRQEVLVGGDNVSKLKQEVKQDAQTTAPVATENQGSAGSGNDAGVHQEVVVADDEDFSVLELLSADSGKNLGIADQYTYQTLPQREGLAQYQVEDPFCCGGSQMGGDEDENEETIKQWVQQKANPDAVQEAEATGLSVSPNGECTVAHNLENNGGTVQTSQTEGPPCAITGVSNCVSGVEGPGSCFSNNCPPGEAFNPNSGRCEEDGIETETGPPIFTSGRSGSPRGAGLT